MLGDDLMLWFAMMLMPAGPPSMKLIAMVEVSNADEESERKMAKLLTVSVIPALTTSFDRKIDIIYRFSHSSVHSRG